MDVRYETEVTPDQIDHLGHMNVRFYGIHARAGADRMLASLGLVGEADQVVFQRDSIVRHLREQLVGAPLAVRGGVLQAGTPAVRLYQELVNTATDEVAATFVTSFELQDRRTREALALPTAVVDAARRDIVAPPVERLPRTIVADRDPTAAAPTLATLRDLDLAMRLPRFIDPAACDEDGFVAATDLAELVWSGEATPGREFRPLSDLADGVQLGFATLESRATWTRPARAGDQVQSFDAVLEMREKTMVTRHWLMEVDSAELIAVLEVVNVAFDTARRRAIEIPEALRVRMTARLLPELGPTPLA